MNIQTFNLLYVNFYSALLLLVLLAIIYIKRELYNFSSKIFKYMIIINIILSIFEVISLLIDGMDNTVLWFMNYTLNFTIFLLTPLIGSLWAMYIDHKIFQGYNRRKFYYVYLTPFFIVVTLLLVNLRYPVLFSISANNVYSREPLIMFDFLMLFTLLILMTYIVLKNRKKVKKSVVSGSLIFLILPAIGGIIQMSFYGVATLYSAFSLGIISSYIILETIGSSIDNLTGLFTRDKASEYINELINTKNEFGVLLIDLDDFKKINDEYGHNEGDKYLKLFGEVLTRVFEKDDIISRFGGDEFIIVKNNFVKKDKPGLIKAINDDIKDNLNSNMLSIPINFSVGCSVYNSTLNKSEEELIIEADNNMYLNKAENKNLRRRKSDK